MKFQDIKYLAGFSIPLFTYFSIIYNGIWSWGTLLFAFVFIPILELIIATDQDNKPMEEEGRNESVFFDILLYLNLPLVFFIVFYGLHHITDQEMKIWEVIGKVVSIGIMLGASGINVAHEIGHKPGFLAQFSARLLLTPCLYNHFTLQHNRGHHLNVGTDADPATARYNETLYAFWWRCITSAYKQAWDLEHTRLKRLNIPLVSSRNEMILNTAFLVVYLIFVMKMFGYTGLIISLIIGLISFLLLETINYIEHYGLYRKKTDTDKYERVELYHSWNSNHQLGRMVLYELTRHADHHFKANKKYQMLLHHDQSPQLPYGYPASMLLSLLPTVWFRLMNPLVDSINAQKA
jgi:alkane 1-monooxygenase